MIGYSESQPRLDDLRAPFGKLGEGMERSFMYIMAIYPKQRLAVITPHNLMCAPKFVNDRLRLVH
jgi:hypothetical protein